MQLLASDMDNVFTMKYCVSCLQPDTGQIQFSLKVDSVLHAYLQGYREIDWDERFEILNDLVLPYRRQGNSGLIVVLVEAKIASGFVG